MRRSAVMWVPVAFVAFLSVCSTVFAADLHAPVYKAPPPLLSPVPVFSWTGLYVGGHIGYGWANFAGDDPAGGEPAKAKGWLGGVTLGYNYQINAFVIGVEGDYSWANVNYTETNIFGTGGEAKLKNDFYATAALRLGYAVDRFLIYGKGGAAWTRDKWDVTDGVGGFANGTFNRVGWMVGGGVEYAFWNNWSAKVEYNYLHFKSIEENLTTGGGLTATPANVKLDAHLVKLGLNYRFNIWN